jgi:hypothetical protein
MDRFTAQCLTAIAALLTFSAGCFRLHRHLKGEAR